MRLHHGDDAPLAGHAGGAQHGGDLDGMMRVIVIDHDALPLAGTAEAPLHAGEGGEGRADHLIAHAGFGRCGERAESVQRVVMPEHRKREILELARAALHARAEIGVEGDPVVIGTQIGEPDVGVARHAIGQRAAAIGGATELGQQFAHHRMIDAGDGEAIERDRIDELVEGLMQRVERRPIIHVLGVDIGDHADLGRELQERTVGLVGLDHHPFALADAGIGAPGIDDAAGDHGGVEIGRLQQIGDQRGGGGLAVGAGDRHGGARAHQLGQHLGAANDGKATLLGRFEFGIAGLDRAGDDEMARAFDVVGIVADQAGDAAGA